MKARHFGDGSVFRKTTLPNGLRILTESLPTTRSTAVGVWIDVGSRHEDREENGLSHFIEHMLFKGTTHRNAKELASALESLGGSLNGFTSREQTCYYARVLDEHLPVAVDVLADLTCHPRLSPIHVGREKQVVCEEIKEAADNPSDRIHDIFSQAFWGDHPLGQPIMGSQEIIRSLSRGRTIKFMQRHYKAGSVVIAACGSVRHEKLVEMVRRKFRFYKGVADKPLPAQRTKDKNIIVETGSNAQAHFTLGFPAPNYSSPDKMTVLALSTYLGGGMSSVLFQKIREDRGLAYSVYTFNDFYRDSGVFGVYVGTDKKQLRQALSLILKELERIKRRKLDRSQLQMLKSQMMGHLILSQESSNSRMNRIARQELMTGRYLTLEDMLREIRNVKATSLSDMASQIFDESKVAMAVLGKVENGIFRGLI